MAIGPRIINLHSNNSVAAESVETDQLVHERRHANDLAGILAALGPYRAELVQYRTARILSNGNILAAQTGARLTSTKVNRLTDEKIATLALQANAAVMRALQLQIAVLKELLAERTRIDPDS